MTGNGERDMHSERMPVMAKKYAIGHMAKAYVICPVEGLNHRSAAEALSLTIQIWKCSHSINDFEPKDL